MIKLIYRNIPGYERLYEISVTGCIRNIKTKRLVKTFLSEGTSGYWKVCLTRNGKTLNHSVHRLVASTYIPNPNKLPVAVHLDNNKRNCWVNNLAWSIQLDNILDYHNPQKLITYLNT